MAQGSPHRWHAAFPRAQIYDWQSAPDSAHTLRKHSIGFRTAREWPKLKERLESGRPTIIVLITVEGYSANMSENHQVVAVGYRFDETTSALEIDAAS